MCLGVVLQRSGKICDPVAVAAGIEGVGVHLAGLEVVVDAVEQVLFAGLLHLVGAGVVRKLFN